MRGSVTRKRRGMVSRTGSGRAMVTAVDDGSRRGGGGGGGCGGGCWESRDGDIGSSKENTGGRADQT